MMSKISYRADQAPIGEVFEFFDTKLKVTEVEIQPRFAEPCRFLINAQVAGSCNCHILYGPLDIDHVIFNGPATIVFWNDGTKTVVKCADDEHYNKRRAIMWTIMKKNFGSVSSINRNLDKLIEDAADYNSDNELANAFNDIEISINTPNIANSIKNSLNNMFGANNLNKK